MTLDEQETSVSYVRSDEMVYIYTANPSHLRKLRADERASETKGGSDWGIFTVSKNDFDPLRGFKSKRKPMTEEQRKAAADRLAQARQKSQVA